MDPDAVGRDSQLQPKLLISVSGCEILRLETLQGRKSPQAQEVSLVLSVPGSFFFCLKAALRDQSAMITEQKLVH